jgi:hypothetical protein
LGYTTIDGRAYFVRQMKNMKASIPLEWLTGEPFHFWSFVCGGLLARAHSRVGEAAKIAGLCLAKRSYTCEINDLAYRLIRSFPLEFLP